MARARCTAAFAWCLLALATPALAADTLDIRVRLFTDPNCFQREDEFMILDKGCYANTYSNESRAWQLKIVKFQGEQEIDLREFLDDCNFLYRPKRTLLAKRCERFVGPYYVQLETRFRSNACQGSDCSTLSVAVQSFFSQPFCRGLAYEVFYNPLQGECMRFSNGTQTFTIDEAGRNISQIDYNGNDACNGGGEVRSFSMNAGNCFPLFEDREPRSFSWTLEGGIVQALAKTTRSASLSFAGSASLALAIAIAQASAVGSQQRQPRAADAEVEAHRAALRVATR